MKKVRPILLKHMKYFVTVVECKSFTEAAECCYISQSAISQQIRALEEDLGTELIHRENRRFTLTPAGEYFYHHSRELLDEIDELQLRIGYLRCYSGRELHQAFICQNGRGYSFYSHKYCLLKPFEIEIADCSNAK